MEKRPTICLNMIVKNEGKIIRNTLQKLCEKVRFDYWVIHDTGSTDSTMQIIRDFFQKQNIPGELFEEEWRDFAYNRTRAIESAFQITDYLFIFDADDEIIGDFVFPNDFGNYDSYYVYFGNENFKYLRMPIVNNRKRWKYVGVLHEVISEVDKGQTTATIEGDYFFISGRSGARSENPNKYYDDAQILEKAFKKELEDPKGDVGLAHRYAFYCGQSYKDCGIQYVNESIKWYKKVLTLNNWLQEKYVSCLELGNLYKSKGDSENACYYWLKSIEYDKERIEGIVNAAEEYTNKGLHVLTNALYLKYKTYKKDFEDKLFLHKDKYNDNLEYKNCISAFYVNDYESGYECCKRIIINRLLNLNTTRSVLSNMRFYMEPLIKDYDTLELFYKLQDVLIDLKKNNHIFDDSFYKIWNLLFEKNMHSLISYPSNIINNKFNRINTETRNKEKPTIFLSFTTCKRLDLFEKTINSILNQWTDYDLIDYWFCVDDNSSEKDLLNMKQLYPWINYYNKNKEEKGHIKSMNIIWNKLNELQPKYWIHMEDDFLFHYKTNYIQKAIEGLDILKSYNVKQILFNVNYSETIDNYNVRGDEKINKSDDYTLHIHKKGDYNYLNHHYWPHYSFRPSLIDVEAILGLGDFSSENQFFEMDYANKWNNAGYKSGFFNKITCRHIGRLTSERNDNSKLNAYALNDESQFYNEEANNRKQKNDIHGIPFKIKDMQDFVEPPSLSVPIKIINLLKREDRKNEMIEKLNKQFYEEDDYEFIEAVDGAKLEATTQIIQLFKGNDFGSRRGFIGCALTHLNLWKHLLNDTENDYYIIMEDDIDFCDDFKERIRLLESTFLTVPFLFLGYHMFNAERNKVYDLYNGIISENMEPKIYPLDKKLYIGGYFCYSINKKGAQEMIDYIEKNGIKHGIDYLNKINHASPYFEIRPQIAFSVWNEGGEKIDTNIQFDFDGLDLTDKTMMEKLKTEFTFIKGKDQMNNDIYNRKSFDECLEIALNDSSCVAFNSLGFMKNKITDLTLSPYFGKKDGIYIKNEVYDAYRKIQEKITEDNAQKRTEGNIRIKMICDWCSSEQLCMAIKNKCDDEDNYCWKNMQITWENNDIDYYVIINRPFIDSEEYYDPSKTIIFQMEPWVYDNTKPWGTRTWGEWAEPDSSKFLHVNNHNNYLNNVEWHLNKPLKEIKENITIPKENKLSAICSVKNYDEGQILRNNFIKYISEKSEKSEEDLNIIDVYGRSNYHNFKCYVGPLKEDDKFNGMSQYKYHFACENNSEKGYATEKIWDAILAECLCFYWGCPNLEEYIDSQVFVRLDLSNYEDSLKIIKQALEEDWWSQRIEVIRREKQRIIEELAFFPNLKKIIDTKNIINI